MLTIRDGIEIILALTLPVAILGILYNRTKTDSGLSVRTIQFLAISTILPVIGLLALERVLEGSVIGTLLGGLLGYLLGNFSNYDKDVSTRTKTRSIEQNARD